MRDFIKLSLAVVFLFLGFTVQAADSVEVARGNSAQKPQQPQVAVDAKGVVHLVYGAGDSVFYRRSDDGENFTSALKLPGEYRLSLGMRRGPRIAVTQSVICVTLVGGTQGKGRDGDVLNVCSTDGGQSWSEPAKVNDATDSAREGLHAMAAGPKNLLCCTWLDLRNKQSEIMASISSDGGKTWGKNVLVYRSPDGSVCECCHPSVVIDNQGKIYVQWRNSLTGARDMYVASSADQGKNFGTATKLGRGTWTLNACPMDGGAIAVTPQGKIATTWRRDKTVYLLAEGDLEEQSLGMGEQPWLTATANGPYVTWLKKRGDALLSLTPGSKKPLEIGTRAYDPVLAAGPNGSSPVVAVWETREGKDYVLQCQVLEPRK